MFFSAERQRKRIRGGDRCDRRLAESACVDPANYRQDLGEKIAHDNACNKLCPLLGFLLAEAVYRRAMSAAG
jgi:hypothetical protein